MRESNAGGAYRFDSIYLMPQRSVMVKRVHPHADYGFYDAVSMWLTTWVWPNYQHANCYILFYFIFLIANTKYVVEIDLHLIIESFIIRFFSFSRRIETMPSVTLRI